jgi:hypothetical protein
MNKTRRIGAMVAATAVATGMAMTVTAGPAAAARPRPQHNDGPRVVNAFLGSVDAGDTENVKVWFQTDETVCDFQLQVQGTRSVQVWHFGGRTSSLSRDDMLQRGERDYASIKVRPDYVRRSTLALLPATIWYRDCDGRDIRDGRDGRDNGDNRDGRDNGDNRDNGNNGNNGNNGDHRDQNRNRMDSKHFGLLLRIDNSGRR